MTGGIGTARGTALCVGAVLGPGVLVLPAVAVRAAGPASLLAWATLLGVSALIATSFAALGARYPDMGGVAAFTQRAFGDRPGAVVGCWLFAAVPFGVVAAAGVGARYCAAALDASAVAAVGIAVALLTVVYLVNLVGLHLSARMQLVLTAAVVGLLVAVVAVAGPRVEVERITPFAPHGVAGVGSAIAVLFASICGWEATANLSAEVTHPRLMRRVARVSLAVVVVLYTGLAVCTVGVLGDEAGNSPVPLMRLLAPSDQPWVVGVVAVTAALLTVAASVTFVAAGARAGVALARHRVLPASLAVIRHGAPRRGVAVQAAAAALVAAAAIGMPRVVTVETLIRVFAALLACVTLAGLVAAVRLLPTPRQRACAAVAALAVAGVVALSGPFLLAPAAVAVSAWRPRQRPPRPSPPRPAVDEAPQSVINRTRPYAAAMKAGIR